MRITPDALLCSALIVASLLAASCGDDDDYAPSDSGEFARVPTVVTTVSPITNIVENIAGDRIRLVGIVPEGVNSHTFEPAPSDAEILSDADIIFVNGLQLEEPTVDLAEDVKKDDTEIISLGDQTITPEDYQFDFSFPEDGGAPNPHLWPNVPFGIRYAEIIRDSLVDLDPVNADYYEDNAAAYIARLEELDAAVKEAVQTIPEENRKLLTYHDSYAYFALETGFEVIGAVQPSDFGEPSASEVADLIDQIESEGVTAVFGSEEFPSDVLEQIASESGADYIDELRDDDLPGEPGDPEHSYIGLILRNMRIMIPALGGNVDALEGIEEANLIEGTGAEYPQ
ncbi:MAG: metal ABC transporter substrate-binding protein [Dehalococcoidia bacterium]